MISLRNRRHNLNEKQKNKINKIKEALNNNDINTLRNLSRTEGGFVTSELRKLCWPFLLHIDVSEIRISEKNKIIQNIEDEVSSSSSKSEITSDTENENTNIIDNHLSNSNTKEDDNISEIIESAENQNNDIEEEIIDKTNNTEEINDEPTIREINQNNNDTIDIIDNDKTEKEKRYKKNELADNSISEIDISNENKNQLKQEELIKNNESEIKNEDLEQESSEIIEPKENNESLEQEKSIENIDSQIKNENSEQFQSNENEKIESNKIEQNNIKLELTNNEKIKDNCYIGANNEIELIKKENGNKEITSELQETFEIKDDLNSETLKDDINENIETITQENIIITSQSSNDDTYLEKESIDKKENLLETSDNEDYTKNNHSDDESESDDVLFKGDININAGEIHESHFKDSGKNKEIFDGNKKNANKTDNENKNEVKPKKCVAKDVLLDSDSEDDPERMEKLKQIENESKYRDKRQIMLDVNRAFVHFPKGLKAKEKTIKQIELSHVILYSLKEHSYLHYYQGYHDICSLLLLVLGEEIAKPCAEILALYWLREYMKATLEPTLEIMSLLYPILKYADPKIYKLVYNNMIPPYFSISWIITWCIHDLRDTSEMERIFDFFISNNPIMPIYFAAAVILTQKEKLYNRFPQILDDDKSKNVKDDNDPETSMPNFSVVHQFLTNLLPIATSQTKDVTVDSAVELAWSLYEQYPLKFLMKKESIKLNSLCCVNRYFNDCEKVLPNKPFNKEEIIKLLKKEEELNLKMAIATPNSKNDHIKKIQEKADIIGNYLSQRITLLTIATTLILVTAIILTHEFSKSYYM
jgi:hypothetical protein